MEKKDSSKWSAENKIIGISSLYGLLRGFLGFPLEQPLEVIKT